MKARVTIENPGSNTNEIRVRTIPAAGQPATAEERAIPGQKVTMTIEGNGSLIVEIAGPHVAGAQS